ncbi:MAG: PQQ-dependent sugar dehydrogenase [Brooklawnia sp.]|uniref:PQQ-dependent sugar dehydrogenase n=1 Tax=Brooklawnia sp. TaxID=2699740 RepID=UPI003C7062D2
MARRCRRIVAAGAASILMTGCVAADLISPESVSADAMSGLAQPPPVPPTDYQVLATGLQAPNALAITPDGTTLVADGPQLLRYRLDQPLEPIQHNLTSVLGEATDLLSLAASPAFSYNRELYVCHRTASDLRVTRISLDDELERAEAGATLLTDLPLPENEADRGCQVGFGPDGLLYVGTSDGGDPSTPQDLTSLGGKILRLDPLTGAAPDSNPFADRSDMVTQLVYSYGHRAVTGLAWHPASGQLYAIDRGPGREDEINVVVAGGNYGWNPASASVTEYRTEGVPMTDLSLPNARPAAYNSGDVSQQLGPATFISGAQWGAFEADLAISNLTGPRLWFLHVTGEVVGQPMTLNSPDPGGSSVALAQHPNGDLLALSSNSGVNRLVCVRVIQ